MHEAERVGFHKKFKLESSVNTSNMVCEGVVACNWPTSKFLTKLSKKYGGNFSGSAGVE